MARERLKDFLSTRGGADTISYIVKPGQTTPGSPSPYEPGRDDLDRDPGIPVPLRPLLRDFLAYTTARNDFPIAGSGGEFTLTTPEGDPAPLVPPDSAGASRVFASAGAMQDYSDSGKLTTFSGETGFVDKSRGKGGNELLRDVKGTGLNRSGDVYTQTTPGDRVPAVVESSLKAENIYTTSQGEQFAPAGVTPEEIDEKGITVPEIMGAFSKAGPRATHDDLRRIGTSLMLKAARIDSGNSSSSSMDVDDASRMDAATIRPTGVFDAASRIDTNILRPGKADGGSRLQADREGDLLSATDAKGRQSYGVMNSPVSPFSGPLPAAMIAQAALGIAAVGAGTAALFTLLSTIPSGPGYPPVRAPLIAGRSDVPTGLAAAAEVVGINRRLLGLISTRHPYIDCVQAGVITFFGGGGGGASTFTGLAGSVLQSPGYYVVIIRAILRATVQVEEALKGVSAGGVSAVAATANLISVLRQTRFVGYMNTLAAIGDNALTETGGGSAFSLESLGISSGPELPTATIPANRFTMSREQLEQQAALADRFPGDPDIVLRPSGRLAWRHASAAATYLVPRLLFQGEPGIVPNEKAVVNTEIIDKVMITGDSAGRLGSEIVQDIESYLDAEYVPFYFHDLRTNEIISFHAFLDSLDDNFNVDVSGETTFGRLDPVQVYRGTSRSLSLSFVIAATSEHDFDEMWFRINKLVTLIYPQWTQGDTVESADAKRKFRVPFSQVVGASPLIRLRVGDVIASNYSKFGLSRLFGGSDPDTKLSDSNRATRFDDVNDTGPDKFYAPPDTQFARRAQKILAPQTPHPVFVKPSMGKSYLLVDEVGRLSELKNNFPIRGTVPVQEILAAIASLKASAATRDLAPDASPLAYFDVTINDSRYPELASQKVRVTPADVSIDPDNTAGMKFVPQTTFVDDNTLGDKSFFSPTSNALVRAFETTRGKGLAGMITSVKFTWLDQNNTWEITRGSRAPIFCKISLGMNIIHDLPLGLGSDGFMLAPAYPVGNVNRRFFGTPYTAPTEEYSTPPTAGGKERIDPLTKEPFKVKG